MGRAYLLLGPVGVPTDNQGDDTGERPRWSTHKQSWDVGEAEGLGESWEEGIE